MVKRLRVEEESDESKVKRLCNKLRGDAREVSHHELEEVANAVEEIRRRLVAPFATQLAERRTARLVAPLGVGTDERHWRLGNGGARALSPRL